MGDHKNLLNEGGFEDVEFIGVQILEVYDTFDAGSANWIYAPTSNNIKFEANTIQLEDDVTVNSLTSGTVTTTTFEVDDIQSRTPGNIVNIEGIEVAGNTLKVNSITEKDLANGVVIEGNTLKDGTVKTSHLIERIVGSGVNVDSVVLKDAGVQVNTIKKRSTDIIITDVDTINGRDWDVGVAGQIDNHETRLDTFDTYIQPDKIILNSEAEAHLIINSDSNSNDATESAIYLQTDGGSKATALIQTTIEAKHTTSRPDHVFYTDGVVFPTGNPPTFLVENERARINSSGFQLPAGKILNVDVIDDTVGAGNGVSIETIKLKSGDITSATLDGVDYSSMTQGQLDDLIDLTLTDSTYSPSTTIITNLDSLSISGTTRYTRFGNKISVFINVVINTTASGGFSGRITLPVSSNLGQNNDLVGTCYSFSNFRSLFFKADSTNDEAYFFGQVTDGTTNTYVGIFDYIVL